MLAAIYTRISSDPSGLKAGVQRQEKECRDLATARGWDVAEVFSDNDTSAYKRRRRPGYEKLVKALDDGTVGAVIAWHPDRLHRNLTELETFIGVLERRGAAVATVQGGDYDLSNASGRMVAAIVGAVAKGESEHKAERHRAKHRELARQGRNGGGGTRPFGFESDRVTVRETEAKEIRAAAGRLLQGASMRSVIVEWNARKVTTSTGAPWKPSPFRRMMLSPRIAGLREHRGEIVGKAEWAPIITEAAHYGLVAILKDPHPSRRARRKYLLTGGQAVCGLCGAGLVARPKDDGRRAYVCSTGPGFTGCGKIRILADTFEDHVGELVLDALDGPLLAQMRADKATEADPGLTVELATVERSLEQLAADHYSEGILTRAEYLAARAAVETRIETLRGKLASTQMGGFQLPAGKTLGEWWEAAGIEARRDLLEAVVEKVMVGPAVKGRNFFDPARVTLIWRG